MGSYQPFTPPQHPEPGKAVFLVVMLHPVPGSGALRVSGDMQASRTLEVAVARLDPEQGDAVAVWCLADPDKRGLTRGEVEQLLTRAPDSVHIVGPGEDMYQLDAAYVGLVVRDGMPDLDG